MRNAILLVSSVLLVAGCKDKTKTETPKPGSASAVASGSETPAPPKNQNEIKLPALSGTPPVKTTKPIDKAKAEAMSKQELEGFKKDIRLSDERGLEIRYKTEARPRIMVTVAAAKCFDCIPMQLDKWKAKTDSLKVLMGPDLKDVPSTTFEMGMVEMAQTQYAWTYHVGYNISPEPGTGIQGAYGTAYAIHYNDGVNMIRVVAEYKDDVPKSREAMVGLAPRADLERIAKVFIDVFVHQWGG